MGKEKSEIEKLRAEEALLYRILIDLLKKIKEIMSILNTKSKSNAIIRYVYIYKVFRRIRAQIKSLDEDITDIRAFESELKKHEIHIDNFIRRNKIEPPRNEVLEIEGHLRFYENFEIKEKSGRERITGMLGEMEGINEVFLHFRWTWGHKQQKQSKSEARESYKSGIEWANFVGLKNLHYQFAVLVADALVRIRKIVSLLRIEKYYGSRIDQFIKNKIIPNFSREIVLISRNFPDRAIKRQADELSVKLRELESLV